jgi:hypothetical protein
VVRAHPTVPTKLITYRNHASQLLQLGKWMGNDQGRKMHIPDDPQVYAQGANAFKAIFDSLRSAITMVRELRSRPDGGSEKETALIDAALDKADGAAAIAQAQVAKALGYELCKCEFPPIPMLTVGSHNGRSGIPDGLPVYECPKCKFNTAAPWSFNRLPGK